MPGEFQAHWGQRQAYRTRQDMVSIVSFRSTATVVLGVNQAAPLGSLIVGAMYQPPQGDQLAGLHCDESFASRRLETWLTHWLLKINIHVAPMVTPIRIQ